MKRTTLRNMKCGIIMTVVILMISVVPVTAQSVTAQDEAPERSLVGVWLVKITPRNCTTGDPIPTAAFESLWTFHKDGTMLFSIETTTLCLSVRQLTVCGGATSVGVITPSNSFTSAVISRPDYLPENRNPSGPWY